MFQKRNQLILCCLLACLSAGAQCPTGVLTYTVTNNSGNNVDGSFARACQCVNASGTNIKTIAFNISGPTIIQPTAVPTSQLTITNNDVLVDGNSQIGIIIDGGAAAGPSPQGILVTGDGVTIQGLTFQNFTSTVQGQGIRVENAVNVNITGNTLNNNRTGISVIGTPSTVLITQNSIFCNTLEGITRGSGPAIPNNIVANTQQVKGTATANSVVEVFINDRSTCPSVPLCQGKTFVGSTTASATGMWQLNVAPGVLSPGDEIVATSTVNGNNTSKFTGCFIVADCSALDAIINKTDITCFDADNGSATASATGFSPAAAPTFVWSNGETTPTISNLVPGIFIVTVTDAAGCTATETVNIVEPAMLSNTFTAQNVKCFGGNDGALTAVPAGGTAPFTYLWSNTGMGASISTLTAGIYTVTITDARACTIVRNTQLTQPVLLVASASATNESAAGAHDGTATATGIGGTPGYTYLWSNGGTSAFINGLLPGTYAVTITDSNLCAKTATATIAAGPGGGPCSALPVYAVLGPSQVCGNSVLSLEVDDLFPNPSVRYVWYFPNGDSTETLLPMLDLLVTSTNFSGEYFVVRDSAGCRSIAVGGAPVTVLSLDPAQVFAGTDTLLCAAGVVVLKAIPPPQGTGSWVSLGSATIDNPASVMTAARNLQTGGNAFVWQVSLGNCTAAASDTVVYFLEKRPLLNDDRFTLQHAQDIAVMEVLLNDALAGLPDTVVTQLGAPSVGTLEYLEEGKRFRYFVEEDFRGTVQFQYVVCSPASTCNLPCDTALVTIDVQNLPSVPEGLVVDDPGLNGRLIIKGISGYSRVEIAVFNRWGSLVFQENDYRNDTPWLGHFNGKALPQGAYYYSLKAWEGNTLVGGAQTGVIHLFSQE
ncbi:MAG TPA: gliding motility-associated C-terminal domain-containing protein [Saprospiraceae bacterium]|nr:gliding motility-associated C-terminal domain-containing protein [Saprospiraceae bacterium]